MKKTWRALSTAALGISMLFGSLGSISAAPVPKDIQGHWAQGQLQEWLDRGILGGYPDGTVKPNKAITRGEYVALINRVFGFTDTASITFTDVKSSNWVYSEVAKAVSAGYIGGYENNTFRANNPLTRQEAAVITAKLLKLNTNSATQSFKDSAQIAAWAKGAVSAASGLKVLNGYPDGTFGPKRALTRAEAVGIISNSSAHKPSTGGGTTTPTPAPTATPVPTATPSPTPSATPTPGTGGGGGGGGGGVTLPTVSGATYGHVGSVTADVYLTPSVTGAVYYVVAPYTDSATIPSALQVIDGKTGAGTAGTNSGRQAVTGGTQVTMSVYGLSPDTEYVTYVTLADTTGNWSSVTSVRLHTAAGSAFSIDRVEPGNIGTVTADVYLTYGDAGGPSANLRYVVLPSSAAQPTTEQIAAGQNASGTALTAPWTGTITQSPGVRGTLSLEGLSANTAYKVYFIAGSGTQWSPVEILRIHTKQ